MSRQVESLSCCFSDCCHLPLKSTNNFGGNRGGLEQGLHHESMLLMVINDENVPVYLSVCGFLPYFYSMLHLIKILAREQRKKKKNKPFQSRVKLLLNRMQIQPYCSQTAMCSLSVTGPKARAEVLSPQHHEALWQQTCEGNTVPPIQAQLPVAELTGKVPAGNNMRDNNL